MALSRAAIAWLMEESMRRPLQGAVLTLGVQDVHLSRGEFEALARRYGVRLAPGRAAADGEPLTAREVFMRLGCERVVTTDVDAFEGCDFVFDLNAPEVPAEHRGGYDLVLDSGTLEHVFHVPNGLANLLAFTRVGGRIVHLSPSSNHVDHGFWMFSPTIFWDYYTANGLELPRFDVFRYRSPTDRHSPWVFAAYRPGALNKQMFGGLGGGCFGIALVAEKMAETGIPVIPQQSFYVTAWSGAAPASDAPPAPRVSRARAAWIAARSAIARCFPDEWRVRLRAAIRPFPLPVRRRH